MNENKTRTSIYDNFAGTTEDSRREIINVTNLINNSDTSKKISKAKAFLILQSKFPILKDKTSKSFIDYITKNQLVKIANRGEKRSKNSKRNEKIRNKNESISKLINDNLDTKIKEKEEEIKKRWTSGEQEIFIEESVVSILEEELYKIISKKVSKEILVEDILSSDDIERYSLNIIKKYQTNILKNVDKFINGLKRK